MSNDDPLREFRSNGLAIGYLLIGLCACVLLSMTLIARAAGLWAIIPPTVGAAGLLLRWQSAPVFVLLGTAIAVMVTREAEFSRPKVDDILLAAALVSYSLALSRLVSLTKSLWPPDPRLSLQPRITAPKATKTWRDLLLTLTLVYPLWQLLRPTNYPEGERRRPLNASSDELGVALLFPAIALAAAFTIWRVVSALPVPLRVEESQWPVGVVVWILITAAIAVRVIVGVIAARRMSREQAQLALNDVVWIEHRRELHRVAHYTALKRARNAKTGSEVGS